MSLAAGRASGARREGPRADSAALAEPLSLSPSAARVEALDAKLRVRLAESLDYLGSHIAGNPGAGGQQLGERLGKRLDKRLGEIARTARSRPISAWTFCLYAKLVAALADDAPRDVAAIVDAAGRAAALPAAEGMIAFGAGHPDFWWSHFSLLLDTDRARPFRLHEPAADAFRAGADDLRAGLALMRRADRAFHDEVAALLRTIVLGSPAEPGMAFDGASTFFLWGATLLNADARRSAVEAAELLVHESGHLLLFALSSPSALTRNSGEERHASPLRRDPRPIDGIFHAGFVATRVHLAMTRLLGSGRLGADERKAAGRAQAVNASAARDALALLQRRAEPTATGANILAALAAYWAAPGGA